MQQTPAKLVLENGSVYSGYAFGHIGETGGEVVFNTAMTGYQEIITDPSYAGQMVVMTYPLIGNYGINSEDSESQKIWASALIVRESSRIHSNYAASGSLDEYLKEAKVMGISGIDTRKLVREIRRDGAMRGFISAVDPDEQRLREKALGVPEMTGLDLVKKVSTAQTYSVDCDNAEYHVVTYDYGIKQNILRMLTSSKCRVTVLNARTPIEEALKLDPDGIFLSNGPGDPFAVTYAVDNIRKLTAYNETASRKVPLFGICLGHQLLALAFGAKTYKLKFGHHGSNHPVKNLETRSIEITSQNHGFSVREDSLPDSLTMTHLNLYDQTVEGVEHTELPCFSVQYHPEAAPGPHDSHYLFEKFTRLMDEARQQQ
ncbi:glutamine-hydrolyzing carbamoyl-phosphate synthase small subunit [Prosthecochloris sp. N3]|uniref:Carbamoyl phosphate synthase small chain n=1 Tax=Prosthecochloris ethylica TaxID=2743976 RepID=A0ABR9XP52_9CHLB|nr:MULTISPECIES: glutamine-hydrolyzing carbamoyl-phosphate synthase small subunit [Prosthecochloris]MBF0585895.1 glutamine-hydrolyzing carbamoyl-phosphate synthase small subunit [Prosthecochloris ethylica]MBF0635805.1 glutamine-hydrolyzing carbamoyl-phosphate synthase small subunit [Prosthecochloris ethylica]NUK47103.1 glutamine-hydrolyzing carbamoyl-phosphate synthase small subunit [Prosthecochloris ethylica]RNA65581.1 carbamoyl-phosphate synthase small subunit [Prosthecochloris sp. ZM_2]